MRVLVACEYSGIVREAFRAKGHDAWSCDIDDTDYNPQYHIKDDVLNHLNEDWDMMIAHPPCTHLCVSGARWWATKDPALQQKALEFALTLLYCIKIPRICLENPIGIISNIQKPTQIIQPWEYGHGVTKATCLWLKHLPKLRPTKIVTPMFEECRNMRSGTNQAKDRSKTYSGIARAMADQWSVL